MSATMSCPPFPAFEARAPWLGCDLQTLRNTLRGPAVQLPDGENDVATSHLELELDDGTGDRLIARLLVPCASTAESPLVILVHGLGGSADSSYMTTCATHLLSRGRRVLQLNLRGAGPSAPLCSELYHAGRSADFGAALQALPSALTSRGVHAVGFSLGANLLLKYTAECGEGLRAVASVSAPIDLEACSHRMLERRNSVYQGYLLRRIKQEALTGPSPVDEAERRNVLGTRSILEFDDRVVAPRNGFADAADYYARSNSRQSLGAIRIPTLLIQALDDPWIPAESYTSFDWQSNPSLTPLLSPGGGHVGFHARGTHIPWHDRCVARFLDAH